MTKNPPSSLLVCSTAGRGPRWPCGIRHGGNAWSHICRVTCEQSCPVSDCRGRRRPLQRRDSWWWEARLRLCSTKVRKPCKRKIRCQSYTADASWNFKGLLLMKTLTFPSLFHDFLCYWRANNHTKYEKWQLELFYCGLHFSSVTALKRAIRILVKFLHNNSNSNTSAE